MSDRSSMIEGGNKIDAQVGLQKGDLQASPVTTVVVTATIPFTATITATGGGQWNTQIDQDGARTEFTFLHAPTDVDLAFASAEIFRRNFPIPNGPLEVFYAS